MSLLTPEEWLQEQQSRALANHMRERQDQRQKAEARERALASPDAGRILELEAKRERLRQDQLEMMRVCGIEGRTLDYEEAAEYDALTLQRAELAHQVATLEAKYRN